MSRRASLLVVLLLALAPGALDANAATEQTCDQSTLSCTSGSGISVGMTRQQLRSRPSTQVTPVASAILSRLSGTSTR